MTSPGLSRGRKQAPRARSGSAPAKPTNGSNPSRALRSLPSTELLDQFPTPLVESMRYLVGRLQLGEKVEFPTRLGVVSALHGEGVTTISRTLAAVIATDLDMRVCWVDLSWPSLRSPQAVELQVATGIYEILTGGMELAGALLKTQDPRMMILEAGRFPDALRQPLVRSPLLATLLDDLEKMFDCVVFDMPPVLAGSAGLGLMRHVESYLLVVRHGVTTTQQVRAATDELRAVPSVGVVLNQFKSSIPKWLAHFFAS